MDTQILARLTREMTAYYEADPARVQHFMKVYAFSHTIALLENCDEALRFVL